MGQSKVLPDGHYARSQSTSPTIVQAHCRAAQSLTKGREPIIRTSKDQVLPPLLFRGTRSSGMPQICGILDSCRGHGLITSGSQVQIPCPSLPKGALLIGKRRVYVVRSIILVSLRILLDRVARQRAAGLTAASEGEPAGGQGAMAPWHPRGGYQCGKDAQAAEVSQGIWKSPTIKMGTTKYLR